jgi:hypothetical protein
VPDVAAWVAAALLDTPAPHAEALLEDLVDAQLVDMAGWDANERPRYRLHDLLHAYACERAHAEEPTEERQAALERALGGWLALADQADRRLPSNLYGVGHGGAPRWPVTTAGAPLADPVAWFEAERIGLVAAVDQAAELGLDELAWDVAGSLINFLDLRGYLDDWRHTHEAALAAVRRAANRRGEASLLRGFGYLAMKRSGMGAALDYFAQALAIFRQVGDRHGEAHAMEGIGAVHRLQGRRADAAACARRRVAGPRPAEAHSTPDLGPAQGRADRGAHLTRMQPTDSAHAPRIRSSDQDPLGAPGTPTTELRQLNPLTNYVVAR